MKLRYGPFFGLSVVKSIFLMLLIRLAVEDEKKEISRLEKQVQLLRHSWFVGWVGGWLVGWVGGWLVGWLKKGVHTIK